MTEARRVRCWARLSRIVWVLVGVLVGVLVWMFVGRVCRGDRAGVLAIITRAVLAITGSEYGHNRDYRGQHEQAYAGSGGQLDR